MKSRKTNEKDCLQSATERKCLNDCAAFPERQLEDFLIKGHFVNRPRSVDRFSVSILDGIMWLLWCKKPSNDSNFSVRHF